MRAKLFLAAAFLAGLLLFGTWTAQASAHPPRTTGSSYYGLGRHDIVPHWHIYPTPFGTSGYYGLGAHDFIPHDHSYSYPRYHGQSYYAPYPRYRDSYYDGYPWYGKSW